jgi:hypothetical protein
VSTTEELLDRKVPAPVYKTENTAVGIRHADHVEPLYPLKLAITSPTSGGRSVGIVRSRTQTMEVFFRCGPRESGDLGRLQGRLFSIRCSARWRRVVSFTPRSLYPQGNSPGKPSDRRLGGPGDGLDTVKTKGMPTPVFEPGALPAATHGPFCVRRC